MSKIKPISCRCQITYKKFKQSVWNQKVSWKCQITYKKFKPGCRKLNLFHIGAKDITKNGNEMCEIKNYYVSVK